MTLCSEGRELRNFSVSSSVSTREMRSRIFSTKSCQATLSVIFHEEKEEDDGEKEEKETEEEEIVEHNDERREGQRREGETAKIRIFRP